jgi:hypothetical protein
VPECVKSVSRAQFRRPAHRRAANAAAACNKFSRGRDRPANSLRSHGADMRLDLVASRTYASTQKSQSVGQRRTRNKGHAEKNHRRRPSPPRREGIRVKWNSVALIEWISLSVYLYRTFHVIYLHLRIAYRRLNKSTICWIYNFSSFYNLSFHTQVHFLRSITKRLLWVFFLNRFCMRDGITTLRSVQIRQQHFER